MSLKYAGKVLRHTAHGFVPVLFQHLGTISKVMMEKRNRGRRAWLYYWNKQARLPFVMTYFWLTNDTVLLSPTNSCRGA